MPNSDPQLHSVPMTFHRFSGHALIVQPTGQPHIHPDPAFYLSLSCSTASITRKSRAKTGIKRPVTCETRTPGQRYRCYQPVLSTDTQPSAVPTQR